ncbi:MAG: DivIVA domain-containing protein [Clostridia bacterium]|nr:DivIVA domain-containing protein [Clostridia bacterium]
MEFARRMYGYEPKQVDEYVESMKADYEEELDKKKDRLTELVNENRAMRIRIE